MLRNLGVSLSSRGPALRAATGRRWASSVAAAPKRSQLFIPIEWETPSDAQVPSHRLLLQAGFVKKTAAGIYTFLPLGLRSLEKAITVIDEEMKGIGGQKISMPKLQPSDLWRRTGRWTTTGQELIRFQDRKGEDFCLAPTAEEVVTDIVACNVHSYKQLPVILYQIGEKYRDELRPRYGLIRGREFLMKDMYSFDTTQEAAHATYEKVVAAYHRVMKRFGLPYVVAEADSGNIGGNKSHEFHALADVGEDVLLTCPKCGQYTANVEKARGRIARPLSLDAKTLQIQVKDFEDVLQLFNGPETDPLRAYVFVLNDNKAEPLLLVLPHGIEPNEFHVKSAFPNSKMEFKPFSESEEIIRAAGAKNVRVLFDTSIQSASGSANESHKWIQSVFDVCTSEAKAAIWGEFRFTKKGDLCPGSSLISGCMSDATLEECKGIEVGHCFYLGTKYSAALDALYQDHEGNKRTIEMGCFGIGVSRILATAIETSHDEKGIAWPEALAPYKAVVVPIGNLSKEPELLERAESLYSTLVQAIPNLAGEVVIDDREAERPGYKMKEAGLIGYPHMLILGSKFKTDGLIEVEVRKSGAKHLFSVDQLIDFLKKERSL